MRPTLALGWRTRCTTACLVLALLLVGVASGCNGTNGGNGEVGDPPPVPSSGAWGDEGDDAFDDAESDELSQAEYEEGWATGYAEGCTAIFFESPDGYLYSSGVKYEAFDCEGADPGPDEWDFSASLSGEPETDGAHDGWEAACAATFEDVVGDDLYWGDEDVWVTQADCELANAY